MKCQGLVCIAMVCFAFMLLPGRGHAASYPTRPVRFIVPGPAGGTTDLLARAIAQRLSESLRQQFVIDNRPGASGIIGSEIAAKAAPDGYTLLLVASSFVINPSMDVKLPYDTVKDFQPVTLVAIVPLILVVNASINAMNVRQLIELAKTKPGSIDFGSGGRGTAAHLAGELFNVMAGVQMVHVPYKGVPNALPDLIAGRISVLYPNVPLVIPLLKEGKLKALGVTTAQRITSLPKVPTISESGLPGYEVKPSYGILVPARTPSNIASLLSREIRNTLQTEELKERMNAEGVILIGTSADEYADYIKSEIAKWASVARRSGAHP